MRAPASEKTGAQPTPSVAMESTGTMLSANVCASRGVPRETCATRKEVSAGTAASAFVLSPKHSPAPPV